MGICLSKSKPTEYKSSAHHRSGGSDGGRGHHHGTHQTQIQYTKSAGPETQSPMRTQASRKPVETILGKAFEDVKAHYTLGKELGRGQFGVTFLCTEISSGHQYACKSISKKKLVTKSDKADMRREIQIMQHLSGQPNIVAFKGAYEDKNSVCLVMELCAGGELFDRIIAKGHYTERAAASMCRAIVNVVHVCRLRTFSCQTSENAALKATDFGLSMFIEEG